MINKKLKDLGVGVGYANGGDYVSGGINKLYSDIKETRTTTPSKVSDAQMGEIRTALDNGYPVIIGIDYNPKDVDYDSHFVVVVDYDASDENNLTIADPITGKLRSLKDYLGWYKPNARTTIESYVVTSGPKPKVSAGTITVSKDHYDLYLRNHDEWHKIVHYLKPEADPNSARFEEMQTIIAGIKSRSTDLENQLNNTRKDNAVLSTEVDNRKEQVSRLEEQLLTEQKQKKAEIDALIASMPDVTKIRGEYEGRISDLQGQVDEAKKEVGKVKLELAECKNQDAEVKSAIQKLFDWVRSFIKL